MSSLEYNLIDPSTHREEINNLFEEVFKERIAKDQFVWKYEKNPLGKMKVWSVRDGNTGNLVAAFSAYKRHFIHQGEIVTVYQQADGMVKAELRKKGVFRQLSLEMADLLRGEGALFILGYGNEGSASVLRKLENVKELYLSSVYVYLNGVQNLMDRKFTLKGRLGQCVTAVGTPLIKTYNFLCGYRRKSEIELEPLEVFGNLPEDWSFELGKKHIFFPLRDKGFLNWKALEVPEVIKKDVFAFWCVKGGKKVGYCVLYRESRRNILKLIDILCRDSVEDFVGSLRAIVQYGIHNSYDAITTNVASEIYGNALRSVGFIKSIPVRCLLFFLRPELLRKLFFDGLFWVQLPIDRDNFDY